MRSVVAQCFALFDGLAANERPGLCRGALLDLSAAAVASGQQDLALDCLRRALGRGATVEGIRDYATGPDLEALRGNPGLAALLDSGAAKEPRSPGR